MWVKGQVPLPGKKDKLLTALRPGTVAVSITVCTASPAAWKILSMMLVKMLMLAPD